MKVLSAEETREALPFDGLLDALDKGFKTGAEVPLRHHHAMGDDMLLLMPAWQSEGWGGVKIVNVHPGNGARGLPAVVSSYILFDRETGVHRLMLDGAELTARRTAAASALAAKRLARPDSRKLLIVGAGAVAANLAGAYHAALPIEEITVWARNLAAAEALAQRFVAQGYKAKAAADLERAVSAADIISCATLAREPILKGAWLKPGQHVDLIGSFTPAMREADDEVMRRARIYIDTEHAKVESGDIAIPLATGVIRESDIAGTLEGLCRDDLLPRQSAEEITLFKGVGSAIEDLSAALLAADRVLR
ncbi:ornithine cyclodeaminase family protein [Celeribacter sp. HF31]|uniref:ornithine cyclodeaminase family protein n=1 Tax=Celeribacter sp. HF31 TaxID=2721558 RepID=UPI001430B444|nr:ornithine cyclodeaminase family protein [Celeribacter sp. HF31]NIY79271.1 ornithine cyclodeaminase family protein [Celeribacter sp. HF31]